LRKRTLSHRGETNQFVQGWRLLSPTSSITRNVRFGLEADIQRPSHLRLLSGVKQTYAPPAQNVRL